MAWYEIAIAGSAEAEASRVRILEYNEDDVEATFHLRSWLDELQRARKPELKIPTVESLETDAHRWRLSPV